MQKFSFGSIRDIQETRRLKVFLNRNPVYIPSHLGANWKQEGIGRDREIAGPDSSDSPDSIRPQASVA